MVADFSNCHGSQIPGCYFWVKKFRHGSNTGCLRTCRYSRAYNSDGHCMLLTNLLGRSSCKSGRIC
ncbi:hypothetical protein K435DRAFT_126889 [Dendrothele bispora CBS 962.96]|uniref:Uncharacterized protein n=1 Tax=Dendrothele bispora (strain CBS 962.96) TaxID=1314807 RepID=A0A4S8M0H7_DENBC|nr:hypothetical protein K435DRAFT_126889 [Dendrothele bispora CBS 962.96]